MTTPLIISLFIAAFFIIFIGAYFISERRKG